MQEYGDNFMFVITVDRKRHTPDQLICIDPTCACKKDELFLAELDQQVSDGLLTIAEARQIRQGKQVWQWQQG